MQKAFNLLSVLAILGLAFWVYWQSRTIKGLKAMIPPPPAPVTDNKKSVTGEELWAAIQNKVKEMKIDLTFSNNQ